MSICTSCGHENREEARFCDECGTPSTGVALGGKPEEAISALQLAADRYERQGNLVSTERAHTRLAELEAAVARG